MLLYSVEGDVMQTEKRGVVIQITMFVLFFFIGIFTILEGAFAGLPNWLKIARIIAIVAVVVGGAIWVMLTKKESFLVIARKFLTIIYISLWTMFGSLLLTILNMYLFEGDVALYFYIISGSIMTVASLLGALVSLKMFFSKNAGND